MIIAPHFPISIGVVEGLDKTVYFDALRKEMDGTNQEIITDGAMLISFPLVIYTILLPGILAGHVFSVINMIIAGSGVIAMIYLP